MRQISFKRHRFPPDVIRYAVWLYYRFTMRTRTCRSGGESAKCSASRPKGRPSASFPPTLQFTTLSPSGITSFPARPCAPFERQPLPSGVVRPGQVPESALVRLNSRGET